MQPAFKIIADSVDITNKIKDRLLGITITDEAGFQSDTVQIKLDDRDNLIAWPKLAAKLEIYIGYNNQNLVKTGIYVVDEIEHSSPPDSMTITAKAADMLESLKAPNTRSWDKITIADIVQAIASQNALMAKISDSLGSIRLEHTDQTEESDLHFLTRIAKSYDAIAKPVNGYLVFVPKGQAKSVSGIKLPIIYIDKTKLTSYRMTQAERGKYQSVKASYHDQQLAKKVTVSAGQGEPIYTIRHNYPDELSASKAAQTKLLQFQRGTAILSITMPGNSKLQAEGKISLTSIRDPVAGEWLIKSVEHQLDSSGFSTRCECEIPSN